MRVRVHESNIYTAKGSTITCYHETRVLSSSVRERELHVQWERGETPGVGAPINPCQMNASTGNKRGDLLAELRVLEQQGVLAALELLLLLLLLLMVRVLMLVLMRVQVLVLLLRVRLRALVQHADGPVLSDPIRHLRRVDPHGQLAWKQAVQDCGQETDVRARLRDHGIHFTVDSDATVTGTTIRTIREPMVPVTVAQHLHQRRLEHLELSLRQLSRLQAQ